MEATRPRQELVTQPGPEGRRRGSRGDDHRAGRTPGPRHRLTPHSSPTPPVAFRELVHGVDDGRGQVGLRRRPPRLVTARGLRPFNDRFIDVEGVEDEVVDVRAGAVVGRNHDDDGMAVPRPDRQQAVVGVEVTAAEVLEPGPGEPVARRRAALVEQFGEGRPRCLGSTSTQGGDLPARGCGQVDEDRFVLLGGRSSSRRAWSSGVTRPERTSSRPSVTPGPVMAA